MSEQLPSEKPEKSVGIQLSERISYWSDYFAGHTEAQIAKEEATLHAVRELDGLLEKDGLLNKPCAYSGRATWSELKMHDGSSEETENIDEPLKRTFTTSGEFRFDINYGTITYAEGMNYGFVVNKFAYDMWPKLYYQFSDKEMHTKPHPTFHCMIRHQIFVDAEKATIVPIEAYEKPFKEKDLFVPPDGRALDPMGVAFRASIKLSELLSSTKFRRMSRGKQLHKVDAIIEQTEKLTGIRDVQGIVEAEYAYLPVVSSADIGYKMLGLGKLLLSGSLMGFTMTGRDQLLKKAIRRDTDLWDKREGLCLVMELDDGCDPAPHLPISAGSIINIPLLGQQVELYFTHNDSLTKEMEG